MAKKYPTPKPSTAITTAAVSGSAVVVVDLAAYADDARQYRKAAKAQRTRDTYAARWAAFEAWASDRGLCPLPCLPSILAMYLIDEAKRGISPASMQVSISSIASKHTEAGIARAKHPHRDPNVSEIFAGIKRKHGRAPRRVSPLMVAQLRKLAAVLPDTLIGKRDRALLSLGFFGALRRSEVVAINVADVKFTADGLELTIVKSKVDQNSQGVTLGLPMNRTAAVCPVTCLRDWLDSTGITEGPVFRRVDRHKNIGPNALRSREVARVVQRTAAAAGLDPTVLAGHSLRSGLVSSAAQAGKLDRVLQEHGRWASPAMLKVYIRGAKLFGPHNAADGL